ncbi:unnamed protein product, partial [Mesorhabditis belari]|uniref:Neurotransmitter-gated ion-channel ligand-binding domain-containing protein n=1 Tax=Mesorhabditis belari TaxID=2138241 RepID=A0AAF3FI17_9BILA
MSKLTATSMISCTITHTKKTLDIEHPDSVRAVSISNNGTVTMPTVFYVESSCVITVNVFPFDTQKCNVPIMSFVYGGDDVVTTGVVGDKAIMVSPGNGEWEVTNVTTLDTGFDTMQVFYFEIHLKRVPNFYIYVIALPCFILTLLSIIGMFWSPNVRKEQLTKLSIGLTSMVSMTVLLDMLATAIPKTAVFPLLGE